MKLAPNVVVALAVIAALLLANYCGRRDGARLALAKQRDHRDDSTVSRLAFELSRAEHRLQRERDSTGREIRRLQQRITSGGARQHPGLLQNETGHSGISGPAGKPASSGGPTDVRDSLIASLVAGRSQDSLQILFWRAQTRIYSDSLVPALQKSRDAWRERSERRFACVGGVGISAGLGRPGAGISVACGIKL